MKCCEVSNSIRKVGYLEIDNVKIRYIVVYCDNCATVRQSNSGFYDGISYGDKKT